MQDDARHHIQREIIRRLTGGPRRFTDLKPDGMESNIFMYHVGALMRAGLIVKEETRYTLTSQGITYVDRLSAATNTLRLQPKLIVVLYIRTSAGDIAMLQRHAEPYKGSLMLPSGKMHFGESLADHAARELSEKLGLTVPLSYERLANIAISRDATLLTQAVAAVWYAELPEMVPLHCQDSRFTPQWIRPGQEHVYMPGTSELLAVLQRKGSISNIEVQIN